MYIIIFCFTKKSKNKKNCISKTLILYIWMTIKHYLKKKKITQVTDVQYKAQIVCKYFGENVHKLLMYIQCPPLI